VLRAGRALVWFDKRSHHLVTFPGSADDTSWVDALALIVKDGRVRNIEIRKVNGDAPDSASSIVAALKRSGFVDGYRGLVLRT
jgi:ATP-dependent Lhr-like helicase